MLTHTNYSLFYLFLRRNFKITTTMTNPFEELNERLSGIESLLLTIDDKLKAGTTTVPATSSPTYLSSFTELSKFTGLPHGTLRKISKDIPKIKRGKRVVFRVADIEKWLESHRVLTPAEVESKASEHINELKNRRVQK